MNLLNDERTMRTGVFILLFMCTVAANAEIECPQYYPQWKGKLPKVKHAIEDRDDGYEIVIKVPASHEGLALSIINATICLEGSSCVEVPLRIFQDDAVSWSSFRVGYDQRGSATIFIRYAVGLCSPTVEKMLGF